MDTTACPLGGVCINRVPLSYTRPVTKVTFACVHYFSGYFVRFRTGKDTKEDEIVAGPGYPDLEIRGQG